VRNPATTGSARRWTRHCTSACRGPLRRRFPFRSASPDGRRADRFSGARRSHPARDGHRGADRDRPPRVEPSRSRVGISWRLGSSRHLGPGAIRRCRRAEPAEAQAEAGAAATVLPCAAERRRLRRAWAEMIRRIYEVNPMTCRCGAPMRIVAFILDPQVVTKILGRPRGARQSGVSRQRSGVAARWGCLHRRISRRARA
jgi:hypothetical protein